MGKTRYVGSGLYGQKLGIVNSAGVTTDLVDEYGRMYLNFEPGSQFYVDSVNGSATGDGLTWDTAVTTITLALAKCTASKGDVIWVAPWHAETITAAAGIVFNKIGVIVIGLGSGTLRPTITYTTATTTDIDITAANTTIKNMILVANFADIAVMIDLDAKNFTLEDCEFLDGGADKNCDVYIDCDDTDNACDGLTVRRCTVISPDVGNEHFIAAVGDIDRLTVEDCYVSLGVNGTESIIMATTGKDFTNCKIMRNVFLRGNLSGVVIMNSNTTANSGVIAYNLCGHLDADAATPFDVTGAHLFENYALGVVDGSGLLLPAVDDNA